MADTACARACSWPQRRRAASYATVAVLLLTSACAGPSSPAQAAIFVPGHINDHASLASDGGASVAVVWSATSESTGTNIFAAVSADGGVTFSPPVRVNSVERQANVNGEQPPRVVFANDDGGHRSIVVLWTAKRTEGTALLVARSTDGGRTFEPASAMKGVEAPGNRGWESLASTDAGAVYALWLDHRDTVSTSAGAGAHQHQHGAGTQTMDGVARAQRSQLFVASLDGRMSPKSIARGVCYCCKTALATDARGRIYAAWRHVYAGNRRDIAFAMSRDGGLSFDAPVRVSADDWQIDGCPENGPALGIERSGRVHVVWPTLVHASSGETLAMFHSSSADGRTFASRTPIPTTGAASHPQVLVSGNPLVVAWDELVSGKRLVKIARARLAPTSPSERTPLEFAPVAMDGDTTGSYPALAATASHAVVAWTHGAGADSRIVIRRVGFQKEEVGGGR